MRKLILIVQTSFDGFVAGAHGEFDNFIGGEENLQFVCGLTDDADTALFGRVSYQLLESAWPTAADKPNATKSMIKYSNWYNRVPKIVLSKTLQSTHSENTRIISDNIPVEINKIKQPGNAGSKNILMFGSPTAAHSLVELNLLDGFWLILHPVIFGEGIPLFKEDIKKVIPLDLLSAKQLLNGTICLNYDVKK
jgi:dihydrofolate reductase